MYEKNMHLKKVKDFMDIKQNWWTVLDKYKKEYKTTYCKYLSDSF